MAAANRSRLTFQLVVDVVATAAACVAAVVLIWVAVRSPATEVSRPPFTVPDEPLSLGHMPILGDEQARVIMVEFADFQCPFCAQFARNVLPEVIENYVHTGRVAVGFKHLPLPAHRLAPVAAKASECALSQGKFWPMYDALYRAGPLDESSIRTAAVEAELDDAPFDACMSQEAAPEIQADQQLARSLKISSTPTFLVGITMPDGRLRITGATTGARPYDVFSGLLESGLRAAAESVATASWFESSQVGQKANRAAGPGVDPSGRGRVRPVLLPSIWEGVNVGS